VFCSLLQPPLVQLHESVGHPATIRSCMIQPGIGSTSGLGDQLLNAAQARTFLLDIHYRAHPGVDAALELVHPGGKPLNLDGFTGGNDYRRCHAGSRFD
jgi:hypothetical protein